jgi:dihydropteroate synthase
MDPQLRGDADEGRAHPHVVHAPRQGDSTAPGYDGSVGGPVWRIGDRAFDCSERTLVMGILNVTPDSFSEDGRFFDRDDAVKHAVAMVSDGADMVDVGGESTRPGSDPVPVDEEIERVLPVIERLADELPRIPVSIDTRKAAVAARALEAGATIVNDVSAGADPEMFDVVRERAGAIVLMHMKGEPKTMQDAPTYDDVVGEVHEFLRGRIEAAELSGVDPERIAIDPGIGFGKDLAHNLELMRGVDALLDLGRPMLVGPSRKRFIGAILNLPEHQRVEGTIGAATWMIARGSHVVRVHDVREVVRAVRVIDAIATGRA